MLDRRRPLLPLGEAEGAFFFGGIMANIVVDTWAFCFRCREIITTDQDLAEVIPKDRRNFVSRMGRVMLIHAECMIRGDEVA